MSHVNISITGSNTELNTAAGAVCTEALASAGFVNTSFATEGSSEPVIVNSASALDVLRASHPSAFADANVSVTSFNGYSQEETAVANQEAQELGEKLAEVA